MQAWALENVVVPAARLYGLESEYQYLRPSIKRFPTGMLRNSRVASQFSFRQVAALQRCYLPSVALLIAHEQTQLCSARLQPLRRPT